MLAYHKPRTILVFCIFLVFFCIIMVNLFLIQIWHAPFFAHLGSQQYNLTVRQTPPRAAILDCMDKPLVLNRDCLSAFIVPRSMKNKEAVQAFLKCHFPESAERLHKNSQKQFMYLKRRLTQEEQDLIKNSNLEDIYILQESARYYPNEAVAPIVGITDIDNQGLCGIEYHCNEILIGKPTTFFLERDARSGHFYFKKEIKIEGKNGSPVQLTIDSDLQFLVEQELQKTCCLFNAKEAAAIIMDPENGHILAMVNVPHFDPNSMEQRDLELMKNKVVTESYELGSVIKVFAALAALAEGVVTPDEPIDCQNVKTTCIDGRKINTWKAHGILPFFDVIALSNNIGIALVAKRIDTKLYDHYRRMGFGKKTGIPIPGEQKGFVNPPEQWSKQSIISLSYGYEISATLLQLATAFCMIANGGCAIPPQLILQPATTEAKTQRLYPQETITILQNILEQATDHGTGKRAGIKGYRVMNKTGTANMLVDGQYDSTKNLFTCAGIIEKGSYKRVIVTFVKEAQQKNLYASTVAAPLFERIAERMIIHERAI